MKLVVLVIGLALVAGAPLATGSGSGRIPEAPGTPTCAAAGPYWPTETLAVTGATAWVACKEQSRIARIALPGGRRTATVPLDAPAIAVAVGLGSVWALDSASTLYRLDGRTARVTRRIRLGANAAYNIWPGAGAVWVADDQGASVLRVSPASNRVVARISVGDGPADMVFAGSRAWVLTHRDNTLYRIDASTNIATRLATVGTVDAAAERLTLLGGSLWITGRGMQLLEVDPESGAIRKSIEIGGTGIDVVGAAGSLWVPVRTPEVDRRGFPTMIALRRVTTAGAVTTAATTNGRVDVHGLVPGKGAVWLVDNTQGTLYRIPA